MLVTHDLGVIAGRAERVAVMYVGEIVEMTDTGTLFANPRHPYTEALFHSLPDKAAEQHERLYSIPEAPRDLINPPPACRFAPGCRYAADRSARRSRGFLARCRGTSSRVSTRWAQRRRRAAQRSRPRSRRPPGRPPARLVRC